MPTEPTPDPAEAPGRVFHRDREDRMDHGDPRERPGSPESSEESEETPRDREGGPNSGASGDWREEPPR
ncbi:hypothetical protein ACQP04_15880 [Pseudonocardia halophobica]|uniref:hypothetical protein n=1 Tax=Pseudonocardia halophobica TaxID=29401 RepID=UPI003D944D29